MIKKLAEFAESNLDCYFTEIRKYAEAVEQLTPLGLVSLTLDTADEGKIRHNLSGYGVDLHKPFAVFSEEEDGDTVTEAYYETDSQGEYVCVSIRDSKPLNSQEVVEKLDNHYLNDKSLSLTFAAVGLEVDNLFRSAVQQ